ncbi:MAG TPA: aminoglycoside phosphotransferase family protein [Gemmatimonadaceae bacterium]|nr:aminoglycoside phosphotransferase family protein [Gemmatimonadaceae bacterium]
MDEVHARAGRLARRWNTDIDTRIETGSSLIAFGRRGTEPVVLKVVKRPGDEWRSGEVVNAFGGRGVVRALEYEAGAALLERIVPGTALVDLTRAGDDAAATTGIADVIAAMAPGAAPPWCPTVSEWGRAFARYVEHGDTQIPAALVDRASGLYAELCETQGPTRLLHGDLQHYNVLRDDRRGWLAIDPKGVVGELEYEVGALLRNPGELPEVLTSPAIIERRVDTLSSRLGLDANRVLSWAFAQAVLSAIWLVEDGHSVDGNSASLRLARMLGDGGWATGDG